MNNRVIELIRGVIRKEVKGDVRTENMFFEICVAPFKSKIMVMNIIFLPP